MNERLESLENRIERITKNSTNRIHLLARAVAGMLTCAPHVSGVIQAMGLDEAAKGIDCISRNLGESNHMVAILREMYDLNSMAMV